MSEPENSSAAMQALAPSKQTLRERQRATLDNHRPVALAKSIATRKGKKLNEQHKSKLGASIRAAKRRSPPSRKVSLWLIAEDALLGLSSVASAKKREKLYGLEGGHQPDVYRARRSMGFAGWPGVYRHGEVLTSKHVDQFCRDTDLDLNEACPLIGIGYRGFTNRKASKGDRPLSGPDPSDPTKQHNGRLLAKAYDELIELYCFTEGKRWLVREFLESEVREIPSKHAALTKALTAVGGALRSGEMTTEHDAILNWLCRQTQQEVDDAQSGKTSETTFRTLLGFGFFFRRLLLTSPQLIQSAGFRPGALASELLGLEYRAALGRIGAVLQEQAKAMDPRGLRRLLLMSSQMQSAQVKPEPAKVRKVSARQLEKGQFCQQIQNEMRTIKSRSIDGGRTIVEIQITYPDFAIWKVRDTLSEEDRQHFNHPRRWEAVVGYARTILGKHFDVAPVTVKDWVKTYRAESRKTRG